MLDLVLTKYQNWRRVLYAKVDSTLCQFTIVSVTNVFQDGSISIAHVTRFYVNSSEAYYLMEERDGIKLESDIYDLVSRPTGLAVFLKPANLSQSVQIS